MNDKELDFMKLSARVERLEVIVKLLAMNCACSVRERMSGHLSGCTMPEVWSLIESGQEGQPNDQ